MKREWQIISEVGSPTKNGRYGIIYRYINKGRYIYIHVADFLAFPKTWVGITEYMEVLAWCEFPPIPSQFII